MPEGPAPASFGPRQAQPLDKMLERALGDGWESLGGRLAGPDLQAERATTTELEREAQRLAADARAVFGTPEGVRILEWLCDVSVRRPAWFFGLPAHEAPLYMAMREGQNAIVFTLLKLIASARSEAPPQRQGVE